MPDFDTSGLTVLGSTVRQPIEHLESFPATATVSAVRLTSHEVGSVCPVTGQPDLSSVEIDYRPAGQCIETKSLKLYLWSFRDRRIFAEAMAAEIAEEVQRSVQPHAVRVVVTQRPRGGIVLQATAELPEPA